jgi:hypothetical protein
VQSVIRDFQILCVSPGRIHGRTRGYKWSLLKVGKGKYKGEHGGGQEESGGTFKTYADLWEGRNKVIPIQ